MCCRGQYKLSGDDFSQPNIINLRRELWGWKISCKRNPRQKEMKIILMRQFARVWFSFLSLTNAPNKWIVCVWLCAVRIELAGAVICAHASSRRYIIWFWFGCVSKTFKFPIFFAQCRVQWSFGLHTPCTPNTMKGSFYNIYTARTRIDVRKILGN